MITAKTLRDFLTCLENDGHKLDEMVVVACVNEEVNAPDAKGYPINGLSTSDNSFGFHFGLGMIMKGFALDVLHDSKLQNELMEEVTVH